MNPSASRRVARARSPVSPIGSRESGPSAHGPAVPTRPSASSILQIGVEWLQSLHTRTLPEKVIVWAGVTFAYYLLQQVVWWFLCLCLPLILAQHFHETKGAISSIFSSAVTTGTNNTESARYATRTGTSGPGGSGQFSDSKWQDVAARVVALFQPGYQIVWSTFKSTLKAFA